MENDGANEVIVFDGYRGAYCCAPGCRKRNVPLDYMTCVEHVIYNHVRKQERGVQLFDFGCTGCEVKATYKHFLQTHIKQMKEMSNFSHQVKPIERSYEESCKAFKIIGFAIRRYVITVPVDYTGPPPQNPEKVFEHRGSRSPSGAYTPSSGMSPCRNYGERTPSRSMANPSASPGRARSRLDLWTSYGSRTPPSQEHNRTPNRQEYNSTPSRLTPSRNYGQPSQRGYTASPRRSNRGEWIPRDRSSDPRYGNQGYYNQNQGPYHQSQESYHQNNRRENNRPLISAMNYMNNMNIPQSGVPVYNTLEPHRQPNDPTSSQYYEPLRQQKQPTQQGIQQFGATRWQNAPPRENTPHMRNAPPSQNTNSFNVPNNQGAIPPSSAPVHSTSVLSRPARNVAMPSEDVLPPNRISTLDPRTRHDTINSRSINAPPSQNTNSSNAPHNQGARSPSPPPVHSTVVLSRLAGDFNKPDKVVLPPNQTSTFDPRTRPDTTSSRSKDESQLSLSRSSAEEDPRLQRDAPSSSQEAPDASPDIERGGKTPDRYRNTFGVEQGRTQMIQMPTAHVNPADRFKNIRRSASRTPSRRSCSRSPRRKSDDEDGEQQRTPGLSSARDPETLTRSPGRSILKPTKPPTGQVPGPSRIPLYTLLSSQKSPPDPSDISPAESPKPPPLSPAQDETIATAHRVIQAFGSYKIRQTTFEQAPAPPRPPEPTRKILPMPRFNEDGSVEEPPLPQNAMEGNIPTGSATNTAPIPQSSNSQSKRTATVKDKLIVTTSRRTREQNRIRKEQSSTPPPEPKRTRASSRRSQESRSNSRRRSSNSRQRRSNSRRRRSSSSSGRSSNTSKPFTPSKRRRGRGRRARLY